MKPNQLVIHLHSSCLWCDKEISMKNALKGKMICSRECLSEMKASFKNDYDMNDVVTGGGHK